MAKGLLIKGDMDLELVLMCRDKPTQTLLDTVCHNLPTQIEVRDSHTLTRACSQTHSAALQTITQCRSSSKKEVVFFVAKSSPVTVTQVMCD